MFDPSTVAHEIRWPVKITIWHEDPLRFENKCCARRDDSCGWFTPPYTPAEREAIQKLAKQHYRDIFAKQVATVEGKDYAHVCNEPDCLSAIYWSWRAIKHRYRPRGPWQYGVKLTAGEHEQIYELATCPVDNLQSAFREVRDAETFERLFFCVFKAYLRHHRPWYRHPRWHFWHWRVQVHFLQSLRRWLLTRCEGCGRGFNWRECPTSLAWENERRPWFRGEVGLYHGDCAGKTVKLRNEPAQGNA